MRSFFKIFFASFVALVIFSLLAFFILIGVVGSLTEKDKPEVKSKSILLLDLGKTYLENPQESPMAALAGETNVPSLFNIVRLIQHAKDDKNVSGIYLIANNTGNGPAANNEIRQALLDFRKSDKFVIAYGDMMTQQAYFVASAASKVYVNPAGSFDWVGFSVMMPFIKGTLDKLEIQPQIFYAGKFKSATEPLRAYKMTPENKLQTNVWLSSLYSYFLQQVGASRGVDTASLHNLANTAAILTPQDAVQAKLIDAVKYDDEIKTEIKTLLKLDKTDKMNFMSFTDYNDAVNVKQTGKDRIAVIYAEGTITDGEGAMDEIGGERFRALIRKARLDDKVKAIVLRVNSGGGSALASEIIWRELEMAKLENKKPVIVSFGDVAASGGYYIASNADSIFAHPNTITGSIGVFGIIPNMENFFKNKMGVTFDGVKTAEFADAATVVKPMNEKEKKIVQSMIEKIYIQFKQRVAEGRKKDTAFIEEIAQGRVWSGEDAIKVGLIDRFGSLNDAIACAARMAKLDDYGVKEYPESEGWLKSLLNKKKTEPSAMIREQLGEEHYKTFQQVMKIKQMTNSVQARMPFEIIIK